MKEKEGDKRKGKTNQGKLKVRLLGGLAEGLADRVGEEIQECCHHKGTSPSIGVLSQKLREPIV